MAKPKTDVAVAERMDPETGEFLPPNPMGSDQAVDLPPEAMDLLQKYAGVGYSEKPEDGLVPILTILQDNSGEVKKQHDRYQEGAEPGMFIIRSLRQLFDGQQGIVVQPLIFGHVWVEWTGEVGEGAPVGRFDFDHPPDDMFEAPHPKDPSRKEYRRRSNMNRLIDTREHIVNLITGFERPYPIVVPMSGSNHQASRDWTNQMRNSIRNGVKSPGFARYYRLKTVFKKKGATQTWHGYHVDPGPWVTDYELLKLAGDTIDSMSVKPIEVNSADYGPEVDDVAQTRTAGEQVKVDEVI
jgi:hypothetical protein